MNVYHQAFVTFSCAKSDHYVGHWGPSRDDRRMVSSSYYVAKISKIKYRTQGASSGSTVVMQLNRATVETTEFLVSTALFAYFFGKKKVGGFHS